MNISKDVVFCIRILVSKVSEKAPLYTFWCSYEWFPLDGIPFSLCNTHAACAYLLFSCSNSRSSSILFLLKNSWKQKVFETWLHFSPSAEHIRTGFHSFDSHVALFKARERNQDQEKKWEMIKSQHFRMSVLFVWVGLSAKRSNDANYAVYWNENAEQCENWTLLFSCTAIMLFFIFIHFTLLY